MPQCTAITKAGEQCRRDALPEQAFCGVHSRFHVGLTSTEPVAASPTPTEGEKPVEFINKSRNLKVRYTGNSSYWIRGVEFTTQNRVRDLPYEAAEYLIEQVSNLFEIEE